MIRLIQFSEREISVKSYPAIQILLNSKPLSKMLTTFISCLNTAVMGLFQDYLNMQVSQTPFIHLTILEKLPNQLAQFYAAEIVSVL